MVRCVHTLCLVPPIRLPYLYLGQQLRGRWMCCPFDSRSTAQPVRCRWSTVGDNRFARITTAQTVVSLCSPGPDLAGHSIVRRRPALHSYRWPASAEYTQRASCRRRPLSIQTRRAWAGQPAAVASPAASRSQSRRPWWRMRVMMERWLSRRFDVARRRKTEGATDETTRLSSPIARAGGL